MRNDLIRNDLGLYQRHGADWWAGSERFLRLLANLVPARLAGFERLASRARVDGEGSPSGEHGDTHGDTWHGTDVLDLGCGGGFMAEAVARRGARVVGVDPAWAALRAGEAHRGALDVRYLAGRGEALPLADERFDAVLACDVLEHVAELGTVLDETARVLRPGGRFFFETVNRNLLARLIVVHLGEDLLRLLPRGTHDPRLFIRPRELRQELAARGLDPGPFQGLGPVGLDRRLDLTFARLPTRAVLYLGIARKIPIRARSRPAPASL